MRKSLAPLVALLVVAAAIPLAMAIVFNNPNFAWAPSNLTGVFYLKQPCSFASFTTNGTGGIIDFNTFKWTPTGASWPRFGIVCDSFGDEWNVTAMQARSITFLATASTGRLWTPDQTGGIQSITGAIGVWDPVNTVLDLTVPNPGSVTVTWYAPGTDPAKPSGQVMAGATLIIQMLPLLLLFMAFKYPDQQKVLVLVAIVAALLVLSGFLWGLGV